MDRAVSPETDDGGALDPVLDGSMTGIGSFYHRGDSVGPGATLIRAESRMAPADMLLELRIRGTDSYTRTWMAFRG